MSSLEEAVKRLTIAGTTAWDTPDEARRSWIHMQLASAQVLATIAVAEVLERLLAQEPETSVWARGYAAGWRHPSNDAAEEVAELTPTQTKEPF